MAATDQIEGNEACTATTSISYMEKESNTRFECETDTLRVIFGTAQDLQKKPTTSLPPNFVDAVGDDLNGDFGIRTSAGRQGLHDLWYTFKTKTVYGRGQNDYKWDQITVFSRSNENTNTGVLVCLGLPELQKKELADGFAGSKNLLPTLHVQILRVIWQLYDGSVWSLRDRLRAAEKARDSSANFIYLHELARHLIHSNETLDVAVETLDAIRETFKVSGNHVEKQYFEEQTYALRSKFRALRSRSESLKERLQNEINLAFNLAAQQDNVTMLELGRNSRDDSRNMKAIALVGLVYLPGTFVSGLFGMNFFSFNDDNGQQTWAVSQNFWVYWTVVIPLTLTTVVIWLVALHGGTWKQRVTSWLAHPKTNKTQQQLVEVQ